MSYGRRRTCPKCLKEWRNGYHGQRARERAEKEGKSIKRFYPDSVYHVGETLNEATSDAILDEDWKEQNRKAGQPRGDAPQPDVEDRENFNSGMPWVT